MATKTKPAVESVAVVPTKAAEGRKAAAAVATPEAKPKTKAQPKVKVSPKAPFAVADEQRRNYVEVAAFFIAERRGFVPGDLMADWLAAERQVDGLIAEGKLGT